MFLISDLEVLRAEQLAFERKCYAKNSWASRTVQIKKYLSFGELFSEDRAPTPCFSERVALYATWLARNLSYRSVINYLSSINFFLKQNHMPAIAYGDYYVSATLRGIKRGKADAPRVDRY